MQEFHLDTGSSLVLLDWLTSGRAACGERWEFDRYESKTTVHGPSGDCFWMDALRLDPGVGKLDAAHRLGRYNCIAVLLLTGHDVCDAARRLLEEVGAGPVGRRGTLIASASPAPGGAMLRIAGEQVEDVAREVRSHLRFLSDLLGDDPWKRKW